MSNNSPGNPFGLDPEDFDRMVRDAGRGLRDAVDGLSRFVNTSGQRAGWSGLVEDFLQGSGTRAQQETTGEAGDGVWAIYTVDDGGGAQIEQVYRTELDALRANKNNTDPARLVRFLPYGIAVSVLDPPESTDGPQT